MGAGIKEDEVDDHINEDSKRPHRPYEYEPPSLIDLDDLEGVSGGQPFIGITGDDAHLWPENDWTDDY